MKGESVLKRRDGAVEVKTLLVEGVFKRLEEDPAEQAREYSYRQKEAGETGNPAFVSGREAAAGNHAVEVRVSSRRIP